MKKTLLILAIATVSSSVIAQTNTEKVRSLKLNSFGIEFGTVTDNYRSMNLETMYDLTQNPALLARDLTGHDASFYRSSTGGRIGINASFTPYSSVNNGYNTSREIRFGATFTNSEPMVSYNQSDIEGNRSSIIYCNVVNEVSLNGAYLFKKSPVRAPWLSFYAGLGASLGSSFNTQMLVMENTTIYDAETETTEYTNETSSYAAKSSLYTRIYAPLGVSATVLRKVQFGLEGTIGTGMQSVYGGKTHLMPFSGGMKATLSYVL
jgi:hypothetical protein